MKKILLKVFCKIDPIFSDQYYLTKLLKRSDNLEDEMSKLDRVSDNELYLCKQKENSYIISVLKLMNEKNTTPGVITKYYKRMNIPEVMIEYLSQRKLMYLNDLNHIGAGMKEASERIRSKIKTLDDLMLKYRMED